jgi:alanyl-tRNA synthetase
MPLPSSDTIVLYPDAGPDSLSTTATVLHVAPVDAEHELVLLDRTCAHPVDAAWPDQGPDLGTLTSSGIAQPLLDVVVGVTDGTNLFVGDEVPVRRGAEGWAFVAVHVLAAPSRVAVGDTVTVTVDAAHRRALSVGHTLCHLASLALNAALASRWSKPVRDDALGHPDFDHEAIQSSMIVPEGSVDVFRLNKSLRRKGFLTEGLGEALGDIRDDTEAALRSWIATDAPVRIERAGHGLSDPRFWVCDLPAVADGVAAGPAASARIACGGTHLSSLGGLGAVSVALELSEDDGTATLTMRCATA